MMHGQGKSDSSIVPVKSSNKAAFAAAETMEGRGGAKGNAVRGSTCQTQSWESDYSPPPPHRTQRAELPHWAPTLGHDPKPHACLQPLADQA